MVDIENIESYRDASKLPSDGGAAKKCPARTPARLQNRMPISTFPLQRWSKDSYSSTALFELADRCRHTGESDARKRRIVVAGVAKMVGAENNGYAILRNAPGLYVLGD